MVISTSLRMPKFQIAPLLTHTVLVESCGRVDYLLGWVLDAAILWLD